MDNYIVSARKYRPDNFDSVVGQDSITITLRNSVKTKQIAQAYLFCGPRGVGKTTCARIFAKTINCSSPTDDFEACNQCESCVAFNKLRSLNIHELDAASNNSVDDIRNLIDQVRIPPQIGSYSVYIIDEVHMLSSSAFNAFLKTLEEPPKHVVFILATTEKHKIIPTILSRCQIFDFNRIKVEDIRKRLEFVAQSENISAEQDALQIIAQKADGAMRDALSIFDQIVSFTGKNITYDETIKNLNVLDYEYFFRLTQAFLECDYTETLIIFDEILNKGFEGAHFINGLASHFRDLLICKEPKTIELLEVGKNIKEKYIKYSAECSVAFLFNAINLSNEADFKYKQSQNKRLLIELTLLKISKLSNPQNFEVEVNEKTETYKKEETAKKDSSAKPDSTKVEDNKIAKDTEQNNKQETEIDDKSENDNIPKITTGSTTIKSHSIRGLIESETKKSENNSTTQEEENNQSRINIDNIGTDSFDEEKLKYVWTKYAETQMSDDNRLFAYLNQNKPVITEDDNIVLKVNNNNIKIKLEKLKHEILNYLIKELNNKNIKLSFDLDPETENKVIQTDEEKLKSFIEKNPEIKNLKDKLDLDFY